MSEVQTLPKHNRRRHVAKVVLLSSFISSKDNAISQAMWRRSWVYDMTRYQRVIVTCFFSVIDRNVFEMTGKN